MNGTSNSLIQAVRGPIMLVTLGSLVAMDYFGVYGFSRTWPFLIIMFGVLKLLEKIAEHPQPPQQSSNAQPPGGNVI